MSMTMMHQATVIGSSCTDKTEEIQLLWYRHCSEYFLCNLEMTSDLESLLAHVNYPSTPQSPQPGWCNDMLQDTLGMQGMEHLLCKAQGSLLE